MSSTPQPISTTPGLRDRLRSGTHDLHTQAERSVAMQALIHGQMPLDRYCLLLRDLYAIYEALEPALAAHANHPMLAPLRDPQLSRCEALADDLDALHGPDWHTELPVSRGAQAYVARLQHLAAHAPALLAAHAYVRYLGDLSGGQLLLKRVRTMLELDGARGTRFYEFGEPGAAVLSRQFKGGLASLPADEALIEALVGEAQRAFEMHTRMFDEVRPG